MSTDTDDDGDNKDTLPALPAEDDDSPLGDTDQHSDAEPGEHDEPQR